MFACVLLSVLPSIVLTCEPLCPCMISPRLSLSVFGHCVVMVVSALLPCLFCLVVSTYRYAVCFGSVFIICWKFPLLDLYIFSITVVEFLFII